MHIAFCLGVSAVLIFDRDRLRHRTMSLYCRVVDAMYHPLYRPIQKDKEIRLLVLEPGEGNDTIRCRLKHVSLSEDPKYEALSYVWGHSRKKGHIYCDDRPIAIGKELFDALEALRKPDRERVLWIDALCINQSDDLEKGKQIKHMGDIYACSEHVLIWLGKATSQTTGAFGAIRKVDRFLKQLGREYKDDFVNDHFGPELKFSHDEMKKLYQYDWASIFTLLKHP